MTQENNDNNENNNAGNNTNASEAAMMKRVTWQAENCLSCKLFSPSDSINADNFQMGNAFILLFKSTSL
jgi:hypothetical protein